MSDKEIDAVDMCSCRHIKSWHDVPGKPTGCLGSFGECPCRCFVQYVVLTSRELR